MSCRETGGHPVANSCNMEGVDPDLYLRGINLFNVAEFFDAHEVLEDVWRTAPGSEKKFLQGLIQVAVGLYHHSNGNLVGARSLLDRASSNLAGYPEDFGGIRLPELLGSLAEWRRALAEGTSVPPLPRLVNLDAKIAYPVTQSSTAKPGISRASAKKFDSVPLLDLQRQYRQIRAEVLAAIERVCSSQQFILGAEVAELEREVAAFTGASHAVGCASGTDALWLALVAAGVRPGDSVITTAFSFFASASAIVRAGARPVLVDIDPGTLNLDPSKVEAELQAGGSHKVRALLPVHLYGQCVDMDALRQISDDFELPIIEDAAQAIGAKWRGPSAGSLGVAAAFSFYPTKNLSAYGEAGLVTTRDPEIAAHMRRLRDHGSPRRYVHDELGWNSRMDAIQAAVLRVKFPHVENWNHQRRERAQIYNRLFAESGLSSTRAESPVRLLETSAHAHHVFHQYVIRAQRRDELRAFLSQRKIGTEVYYPVPLHLQPCFTYLGYCEGDLPVSERAAREVLALPMFPELTEAEQKWVVESVTEFYS